jgi:hypothetical protein
MAEYANLGQINTLYLQSQQVALAISHLDGGGVPSSITISPPPPQVAMPTGPSVTGPMSTGMSVSITLPGPFAPEQLAAIRKLLVEMEIDLANQMAALGVTAGGAELVPPDRQETPR